MLASSASAAPPAAAFPKFFTLCSVRANPDANAEQLILVTPSIVKIESSDRFKNFFISLVPLTEISFFVDQCDLTIHFFLHGFLLLFLEPP
ncbi:MAG: hypothetical protein QNJ41_13885 [Xenococcaceae cyanobacterium MO_188.B32]|nr:hypothetical protein [Xenococcaceae cyanobacterium MO_188.B32]